MARDYKLFKTLEIDGTKMGLDEDLGRQNYITKNQAISATNTWIEGAKTTITEPGVYFLQARFTFAAASSTGVRNVLLSLGAKKNGMTSFQGINQVTELGQANVLSRLECATIYSFFEADLPAEICTRGLSGYTSPAEYTAILAVKLVNTLSNLGG